VSCNEIDRQLFRVSTEVKVGNDHLAKFWDSSWCNGHAPRDLAPHLYQLAWRKNLTLRSKVTSGLVDLENVHGRANC
jgi:hypothetical protein